MALGSRTFVRGHLVWVASASLLAGCGTFDTLAGQVAQSQQDGATILRREGDVAFQLCRRYAVYKYFEGSLAPATGDGDPSPLPSFGDWYHQASAETDARGTSVAWSSYCATRDREGAQYNAGVVAFAEYAAATRALAEGKEFDGSALTTIGTGLGTVSTAFGGPSAVASAGSDVGSSGSSLAGPVVTYVRTRELRKLLVRSQGPARCALESFAAYLSGLESFRVLVANERRVVVSSIAIGRRPDRVLTPAQAFDLASDGEYQLDRYETQIASDQALLAVMNAAEEELATAASDGNYDSAKKAATALSRAVTALDHKRPEDP